MLISYNWIKQFINLSKKPQLIADKITLNLVEVESFIKKGNDFIFEIENKGITNRQDCFSQIGLARELAAYFNLSFNDPLKKSAIKLIFNKKMPFDLQIKEPQLCYRYSSIVLTNVKVKPSPKWLKEQIENCGVRSINNVVDITNYVMLEFGQPMHTFDYDKIEGAKIVIRRAKDKENITTLDGENRILNKNILVIADRKKPLGIAGIMGGTSSQITEKTKTIILESANFDKINNRQSEKYLKLRTDASTRFEKGLDINLTLPALYRTVKLLQKIAEAKPASKIVDKQYKKVKSWKIKTSIHWINKFLGINLRPSKIQDILKRLQLKSKVNKDQITVSIPTYRLDLKTPADIAEEVARIYGYDNIPFVPLSNSQPPEENREVILMKKTKQYFQAAGFSEVLNYPFLSNKMLKTFSFDPKRQVKLINPLTVDQTYFRPSLLPSLLKNTKDNLRYFNQLKLFEIAKIFISQGSKQPKEIINLAAIDIGKNSYLKLKGVCERLFVDFGIKVKFQPAKIQLNFWRQSLTADVVSKNEVLGKIGKINSLVINKMQLDQKNISLLELNFSKITELAKTLKLYHPFSTYPPIIEHLTFINQDNILVSNILEKTKKTHKLIKSVTVTDTYQDRIGLEIHYQSSKRSLSDKEIAKIRKKIVENLTKLGLTLHGELK